VTVELVSDRGPDQVGPIGVQPLLDEQVDAPEIDRTEVDCDLLRLAQFDAPFPMCGRIRSTQALCLERLDLNPDRPEGDRDRSSDRLRPSFQSVKPVFACRFPLHSPSIGHRCPPWNIREDGMGILACSLAAVNIPTDGVRRVHRDAELGGLGVWVAVGARRRFPVLYLRNMRRNHAGSPSAVGALRRADGDRRALSDADAVVGNGRHWRVGVLDESSGVRR